MDSVGDKPAADRGPHKIENSMRHQPGDAKTPERNGNPMTTFLNRSNIGGLVKISGIDAIAGVLGRYGLVVVIGWIGALKFANYEAHQIVPLVANSPFMGWLYHIFPVYTFSALLGVVELTAAVLLAIKPIAPKLSILGSLLAILLFVSTVSFLFTTPGVAEAAGGGFPALSLLGEFLLKDVPLLGLSFWTLADSIRAGWRSTAD
jgi:reactive chlorine resistance protein C